MQGSSEMVLLGCYDLPAVVRGSLPSGQLPDLCEPAELAEVRTRL